MSDFVGWSIIAILLLILGSIIFVMINSKDKDDNWSLVEDELHKQGVIFYGCERLTTANVDTVVVQVFPEFADVTLVTDDNYEAVAAKYQGAAFVGFNQTPAVQIRTVHGVVFAYSGEYLVVATNGLTFSCTSEELVTQTF